MTIDAIAATTWDVVIVGGGSAGCVLAGRLSEDPARKVLLIEAGRDLPPGSEPAAIRDMYPGAAAFDPGNHWDELATHLQPLRHNAPDQPKPARYEQAKLIGGGSSINGQVANRGIPDDYDEWAALGARGWAWNDVLPYFRRLERDLDCGGELHGDRGPIPIHRIPRAAWPGFSRAVGEALTGLGYRDIGDQNACFEDGWFAQTLSNDGTHRVSAAMAYLDAAARRRPNLAILADARAARLVWSRTGVAGVEVTHAAGTLAIAARETVVAAGAINSPALLLRSGIGPGDELAGLGVEVKRDLRGVGRNLQEHPGTSLSVFIARDARLAGTTRRHGHLGLRFSSGLKDAPRSDLYFTAMARSAWHPLGLRVGTLMVWLNKIYSRGSVVLRSADPSAGPLARFEFLADWRDAARLMEVMRFLARLAATEPLAACVSQVSPSSYSGFAKALGRPTLRNLLLTAPTALALDVVPALRGPMFRRFVAGGAQLAELLADDEALERHVRARVFGQWHPCGTCRMGGVEDRDAVVDPASARVHGVAGLRVVDASVMPVVPRANLNIPTIMVAEKFAAAIARA